MTIDTTGLVLPSRVEITDISSDERSAQMTIEPLEPGYGHTLGNGIRRVLLSSLQGAAVWAFRVDEVLHEHETIASVSEDVHEIIQNLKGLVLSLDDDVAEADLLLEASEAGPVTAAEISAPGSVTIHDPEHHILTLVAPRELRVLLRVNKGRGFTLAEEHDFEADGDVNLVRIDSIYSPVLRANFEVEETLVGQRTDFERLRLDVTTDGSVDPVWAVQYAAELIRKHFEYFNYLRVRAPAPETPKDVGLEAVPNEMQELLRRPLEGVSTALGNILLQHSITTLYDVVSRRESEIEEIRGIGKTKMDELKEILAKYDLSFGMQLLSGPDERLYYAPTGNPEDIALLAARRPGPPGVLSAN